MRKILKGAYLRTDKEFITPKNAPQKGSTAATVSLLADGCSQLTSETVVLFLCRGGGQCGTHEAITNPADLMQPVFRRCRWIWPPQRVKGELATRAQIKMGIKAGVRPKRKRKSLLGMNGEEAKDPTAPLLARNPEIASMILSHNDEFSPV
jgi:hypothetical protein